MKFKRAKRAIARTPQVTEEYAVAHFAGCNLISRVLGFRSQSLAPPQALRYRRASRAKAIPLLMNLIRVSFSLSMRNDKLKEAMIKYREAVSTSSPTLPRFGGYVG